MSASSSCSSVTRPENSAACGVGLFVAGRRVCVGGGGSGGGIGGKHQLCHWRSTTSTCCESSVEGLSLSKLFWGGGVLPQANGLVCLLQLAAA